MNIRRRVAAQDWPEDTRRDIARLIEIWTTCRTRHQGDGAHLFGARSIADAFFTPVATRFRTYSVTLPASAQAYADTLLSDPDYLEWERLAEKEWKPFKSAPLDAMYAGAGTA